MIFELYWFYYLILLRSVISYVMIKKIHIQGSEMYYVIINYVPLSFILAYRAPTIGSDTLGYINSFDWLSVAPIDEFFVDNFECGYVLLNKIVYLCGGDGYTVIKCMAIFSMAGIGMFFLRYSENVYWSTILFIAFGLFFPMANIIRQVLASVFVLWAMGKLSENRRIIACVLVLVGSTFHASVILFLFFIFFYPINIKKILLLVCISIGIFYFIHENGVLFMVDLPFTENVKYLSYIDSKYGVSGEYGALLLKAIMCFLIFVYGAYKYVYIQPEKKLLGMASIMMYMSMLITLLGYQVIILGRFVYTYFLFFCILMPSLLMSKKNSTRIFVYAIAMIASFVYYTQTLSTLENNYVYYIEKLF